MKENSNIRGTALIKFLLITFRSIFLLYSLGLVIHLIIGTISLTTRNQTNETSLPVTFRFTEVGNLVSSEAENLSNFNLHYARGVINSESFPIRTTIISMLVHIVFSICVLLIIKLICEILEAAKSNDFLVVKNAIRMRHMALLFILMFFIDKLHLLISSSYLSDMLEFPGIRFSSNYFYSFAGWEYVFFYLFLLVIAEAFRVGAQLKQENDLTI